MKAIIAKDTANLRKKLSTEKRGAIGSLNLLEGREFKEEGDLSFFL